MENFQNIFNAQPKYLELLGPIQAHKLLTLFSEIRIGKYDKNEIHSLRVKGLEHPVLIRAIRADMQSFMNTFIEPYLELKAYMNNVKYIIDAGANIGCTAALFANWWKDCKIISIEPDKENYELAVRNLAPYENVTVLYGALWNKESDLMIEAGQEDGFVVHEIKKDPAKTCAENLTRGFSVNTLMEKYQFTHIDFLKMNIEGSEKEVFSSNYQTWLPLTKSMLIELHDGKNAGCSKTVFSTLHKYDYAVAETAPYGVLFVKEQSYRKWYAHWYREEIYKPNINKERFPDFYLDKEINKGKCHFKR
jgi:FkbM family methyltransferase